MRPQIPKEIRTDLKAKVSLIADKRGYMSMPRPDSGRFIDELVSHEEVGRVLEQHMPQDRIRTYIKDGILNSYAKLKSKPLSKDLDKILASVYSNPTLVQSIIGFKTSLHEVGGGLVVLTETTYRKYETGLRKLLEFVSCKLDREKVEGKLHLALLVSDPSNSLTQGDKQTVERTLDYVKIRAFWR